MLSVYVVMVCFFLVPLGYAATTLRVAMPSIAESLDPYSQLSAGILEVAYLTYDPLARFSKEGVLEPVLAERWEQQDPTTYIIHLRKNVRFQSGNAFTANDVVWTLNRIKKSPDYQGLFALFDAKKVDDYTVMITLKKPYPLATNLFTYILPMDSKFFTGKDEKGRNKDSLAKTNGNFADTHACGTGPFSVVSLEAGKRIVFQKNPNYWGKSSTVDALHFIAIKEEGTRVAALLRGDVDVITPVPVQDYDRLKEDKAIKTYFTPTDRLILLTLNSAPGKPLRDKKLREAIVAAVNIQGITTRILKGQTKPAYQIASKKFPGYDASLGDRYALTKAQKLLSEAGYSQKNPLKLTMIAPNNRYLKDEEIAKAFVFMMARVGVEVSLKTYPKAQYWGVYDKGEADIAMIGWSPDTKDTANYGEFVLMSKGARKGAGVYNAGNYANPAYDALLLEAESVLDRQKRDEILRKSERILYEDVACIPLFFEPRSWAVRGNIKNFDGILNPDNFILYNTIELE